MNAYTYASMGGQTGQRIKNGENVLMASNVVERLLSMRSVKL